MAAFHSKPPGSEAGEMSHRTERLRLMIALAPDQRVLPLDEREQPSWRWPGYDAPPVLAVDGFEGPLVVLGQEEHFGLSRSVG